MRTVIFNVIWYLPFHSQLGSINTTVKTKTITVLFVSFKLIDDNHRIANITLLFFLCTIRTIVLDKIKNAPAIFVASSTDSISNPMCIHSGIQSKMWWIIVTSIRISILLPNRNSVIHRNYTAIPKTSNRFSVCLSCLDDVSSST